MHTIRVAAVVLSSILVLAPCSFGERPAVMIRGSKGSFEKIKEPTELNAATLDVSQQKIEFNLPESKAKQVESIKSQELPWALQRDIPYRIDVKKTETGDVELSNPRLELVAKWDGAKAKLDANPNFIKLNEAIAAIPRDALWIPDSARSKIEEATVAAVVDTPSADPAHAEFVDYYYLQKKSYHGNKHISFSTFEHARETCTATCAVLRRGKGSPHGSGVLIGKKLVLTCNHNFDGSNGPAKDCQLLFHFTDKDNGAAYEVASVYHCSSTLDYCLLELGKQIHAAQDSSFTIPPPPRLGIEPELDQNAGIYVVGHPEGRPLSVALNSQVVIPYRLESEKSLAHFIGSSILRLFDSPTEYAAHAGAYSPKVEAFYKKHYRQVGTTGFYFHPKDQPTIGADPDTKHGNSGGPAFDVSRNALIGLLREGAPDDADFPSGANYANFEAILPISQIVADLDRAKPGWKATFGVTYFGE
jgi:hypothetical protein